VTKRKAKRGLFNNIGRYSGPFNARWYVSQALTTLYSRLYAPRGRLAEMTFTYPIVVEPKMDHSWCYTCKCPKSQCGTRAPKDTPKTPPATYLIVGGPRDGQRIDWTEEVIIVPMTDPYPWVNADNKPVFRTGTYKRMSLAMPGRQTTQHHVIYVWAGEDTPKMPALGDRIRWNRTDYKIVKTGEYVEADRAGDPLGEYTRMTVSEGVLLWCSSERWEIKSGAIVSMAGRRVAK